MKKTTSVLSVITVALAAAALFLAVSGLTVFWKPVCGIFSASSETIEMGPVFPVGDMVYLVGCLVVAIIVCAKPNGAVPLNVAAIVLQGAVLPAVTSVCTWAQTSAVRPMGVETIQALTLARSICDLAGSLTEVAAALCLVVCGMRISARVLSCKTARSETQTVE